MCPHTQLIISPKLRHKIDRYVKIVSVILFGKTSHKFITPLNPLNKIRKKHSAFRSNCSPCMFCGTKNISSIQVLLPKCLSERTIDIVHGQARISDEIPTDFASRQQNYGTNCFLNLLFTHELILKALTRMKQVQGLYPVGLFVQTDTEWPDNRSMQSFKCFA